jgi:hypothetical protein
MCYSAQIKADWNRYRRLYGAQISLTDFYQLYFRRAHEDAKLRLPLVECTDATKKQVRDAMVHAGLIN